jgi:hypothetical protein
MLGGCPTKTVGFYLAATDIASQRALDGIEIHSFLGRAQAEILARSPEPFEQLGVAEDGSLVDFRADGPVIARNQIPPGQRAQSAALRDAILQFQDTWRRVGANNATVRRLASEGRALVGNALVKMLEAPSQDEAQFFGSWVHDDNFGSKAAAEPLVGRLTLQEAAYASSSQLRSLPHRIVPWPGATVEQANPPMRPFQAFLYVRDGDHWRRTPGEITPGSAGRSLAVLSSDVDDFRELMVQLTDVPAVLRIDSVRIVCDERGTTSEVVFEPRDGTLNGVVAEGLSEIDRHRELFTARADAAHLRWTPPRQAADDDHRIRFVLAIVCFSFLPSSGQPVRRRRFRRSRR